MVIMYLSLLVLVFVIFVVILLLYHFRVHHLFLRHLGIHLKRKNWVAKGKTPGYDKGDTPQGLTWVNGVLIFANSWKNKKSRVYKINPKNMNVKEYFDMPKEAVHTSGLCWDGKFLWGVDYKSNKVYKMNILKSFESKKAKVISSFDTTFSGSSACCMINWNGKKRLAISDFNRTRKTIFVDYNKAIKEGTAKKAIVFSYENEGFSQGLEFAKGFLFESENKFGRNVINQLSLTKLRKSKISSKSIVNQFVEPGWGVEDLAWDGKYMWTSDEKTFLFYKRKL
jgi:glutamine cyclotransferase